VPNGTLGGVPTEYAWRRGSALASYGRGRCAMSRAFVLKSRRLVSLASFDPPAMRSATSGDGCRKPKPARRIMTNDEDLDPQRITRAMRADVEALTSTADMLDVLLGEAERSVHHLQHHVEKHTTVCLDDWRIVKTFLRLATAQCDLVKDTIQRFEEFSFEAVR
jgi:hypothetical protein